MYALLPWLILKIHIPSRLKYCGKSLVEIGMIKTVTKRKTYLKNLLQLLLQKIAINNKFFISNLLLYPLHYSEACNELALPISVSLLPGNTAPFEKISQRWQAVGNTLFDMTGLRFEPHASRYRDNCAITRPTGQLY